MSITDWTHALSAQLHIINGNRGNEEMLQAATVAGSVLVCMSSELSIADVQSVLKLNNLTVGLAQQYSNFFLDNSRTIVYS